MPPQARLDLAGHLHHIIARGLDRRPIFLNQQDRVDFPARIEKALERTPVQIPAWSLMPNHFHWLVRPGPGGMAPFMRGLMSGCAIAFRRWGRRKSVWPISWA